MEALIVNILIAGFLLLFGAMALVPMFLGSEEAASQNVNGGGEDRVVRLDHRAILQVRAAEQEPVTLPVRQDIDRPAA